MKVKHFGLAALCLAFAMQADAAAYKCVGNNGKIEYRDVACASSQKVEKTFDQELGSSQPIAVRSSEGANLAANAAPQAEAISQTNRPTNTPANAKPATGSVATADSRSDYALGGLCSGNISWDNCRKLGIDSIVDCKRMDEDSVFRVSVLQSKGIQCRTRPEHPVRVK